MKPRNAALLVALLAAASGCKRQPEAHDPAPAAPAVAPSTAPSTAPTAARGSDATGSARPAEASDPWTPKAVEKHPLAHPLFWSIEKDGKTSYALGTMHMGIDPESQIPDLVWKKLDAAPAFAMETNLAEASKLDVFRHDGGSLRKDLGEDYWKKLEDAIGPAQAAQMDKMKPMLPATMLSMRGLPETPAMDAVLFGRATNEHKQIVFLEPFEKEAAVLEKWMDVRALKEMLDDLPGGEQHSKEMLAAYVAGDEKKILALSDEEREDFKKHGRSEAEYEEQMNDLLYARNASWIPAIEKMHAAGGGFIAVGAMHLIGPKSVLDLLRQKGYQITRVEP